MAKCELNTWEWENSKVACATLSIPYDSTKLMQGTQYPTSNLVMPQVYQMITKLEMTTMTYVHTSPKESISMRFIMSGLTAFSRTSSMARLRLFGALDALAGFPSHHLKHAESPHC